MSPDRWSLYRQMLYSRLFEEGVARLWQEGLISGEMHLAMGEEAIAAGVVAHLREEDAMALDHRGTPPLLMRGVDPVLLLREFLGHPEGLCAGRGGHMHLFSPPHLAASSGIVGASGPTGAGFALAADVLRPGTLAVAFFGEGAMNQGMLMESLNLAVVWRLPLLFVCKDDEWAITTRSRNLSSTPPAERARGFGMPTVEVDGIDVGAVWAAAREAAQRARAGGGPTFLHARCVHLEGHFLGDALLEAVRHPVRELPEVAGPMARSALRLKGASVDQRLESLGQILSLLHETFADRIAGGRDPVVLARRCLEQSETRLRELEEGVIQEVQQAVYTALAPAQEPREAGR